MTDADAKLKRTVWAHYRAHRRDLPWRRTRDPWKILISEVMLQQTQVDRVVPFYERFVRSFPAPRSLARVPLRAVLAAWSGLGYNRRALHLHRAAQSIVRDHRGRFPRTVETIDALPGVGRYTACAILAFAWNEAHPCIETNIRSVYIHHFFPGRTEVRDAQLLPVVERTLDQKDPREWYYALMDYGAMLKRRVPNPSRGSAHHTHQSRFSGSRRELRGAVVRELVNRPRASIVSLARAARCTVQEVRSVVSDLKKEGLLV